MFNLIIIDSFLDWAEKLIVLGSRPSCGQNLKGVLLAGEVPGHAHSAAVVPFSTAPHLQILGV